MDTIFKNQRITLLFLVGITLIYFLPSVISPRDFWVEDEARYAEILREIRADGHWLVVHLNGHPYPDKPPFYFWLAAISSFLFGGVSVFSYMVITWLSTLGTVISAYLLGKRLFGPLEGLIGTLILMSTFLFLAGAGIVRMDMMLTFFVTLSLYFFWEAYHSNNKKFYSYFWIATGFSILTKGPLGLAFPLLAAMVFIGIQKNWTKFKPLFLNIGFVLVFPMGVGWLIAAWIAGYQDFVNNIIFQQVLARATDSFIHKQPFYFYIMLLPVLFLPWSAYVPRSVTKLLKIAENEPVKFLIIWFLTGLITISLISGKLFIYLLPVFPPLALLLGKHFTLLLKQNTDSKKFIIESLINIFLVFGVFVIAPFVAPKFLDVSYLPLNFLSVASFLFLLVGLFYTFRKYRVMLFLLLFLSMGFYNTYIFLALAPQLDPFLSSRTVSEEVALLTEGGHQIGVHGGRRGLFSFYANQKIPEIAVDNLQPFLESSPSHILLLKAEDIKRFQRENQLSDNLTIIYSRNVANITYNLVKLDE